MYDRLKELREDKDLSQVKIAQYLNCSQRIYSNYERGEANIPVHVLIKLAKLHNTSIDYLLNLTDQKTPYPQSRRRLGKEQD